MPHGRLSLCEGARAAERVDQPHFCLASMWHKERKYCDQRCCANEHVAQRSTRRAVGHNPTVREYEAKEAPWEALRM